MPTTVVDLNLSASTGATAKPTYNDILVIGHATSAPSKGFNNPDTYTSTDDVATDYGDPSDVLTTSEALVEMGVEEWRVIVLEQKTVTAEVVGDSDTTSTSSGTVSNTPVHGDQSTISVSLDGTAQNVEFMTVSPPDADGSPASGDAFFNTESGEVVTGDTSSGTGAGIEVDYHHLDWTAAASTLEPLGLDLYGLANTKFGRDGIGDLNEISTRADNEDAAVIAASINGNNESDEQDAMDIAHEVGGYVQSGNLLQVAHKSSDDVAGYVLGQLGVNRPWFDPFWDADGYPFNTDYYDRSNVGDPDTKGTFEGGDMANGDGPTNVIINKQSIDVMSNSLTTAGSASDYQFFDVGRTEAFIAAEVTDALEDLRLQKDQIPYTTKGRASIIGAIRGALIEYESGQGAPLANVDISVPKIDQITDSDKANRLFPGISVTGTLAGNVHEFGVNLNVRV